MKKIISFILAFALLISCCMPAFGAAEKATAVPPATDVADDTLPFILIRGMNFTGLYHDFDTENQRSVLGEFGVGEIVGTLFKALFKSFFDKKAAVQLIIDYAMGIFEGYSCDENGDSVYDLGFAEYPLAASNYPDAGFENGLWNEEGVVRSSIEKYGADNTYYFTYDWRRNPLDVADDINAMVNRAIESSGKDKVNIACASMGGIMTVAYLTKYGSEKIDKCVFLSSTFCGTYVTGDLFKGNVYFGAEQVTAYAKAMLGDKPALSALITVLDKTGVIKLVTKLLNTFVERNKDEVFEKLLLPCFGSILSFWGVMQPDDVQPAIDYMLRNNKEEYAGLITKINELKDMALKRDAMLREMSANGLKIAVVATFDSPLIPAYEHAYVSGDGTLESKYMSGGGIFADIGKTLGETYVSPDAKYLSPDNMADASTCLLPEYTWLIKGAPHVSCSYGTEFSDFLFWLLDYDGRADIHSSPAYPQFMLSSKNQELNCY